MKNYILILFLLFIGFSACKNNSNEAATASNTQESQQEPQQTTQEEQTEQTGETQREPTKTSDAIIISKDDIKKSGKVLPSLFSSLVPEGYTQMQTFKGDFHFLYFIP